MDAAGLARELAAALDAGLAPDDVGGLVERINALFLAHRDVVYAA